MKEKPRLNITALSCTIVMIVSCFLPWAEVSSSVSVMGYSSSLKSNAIGIESGVGIISFLLGVACLVLVLARSKFMVIPGVLNFFFSYMQGIAMEEVSSTITTGVGSGYAGASFGIYILILSCLVYVIVTVMTIYKTRKRNKRKNGLSEIKDIEQDKIKEDVIQPIIPSNIANPSYSTLAVTKNFSKEKIQSHSKQKNISRFVKGLIIAGILIGGYATVVVWSDKKSEEIEQEQSEKESNECLRIEAIIEKVKHDIDEKSYEAALINAKTIIWGGDPNSTHVSQYEAIKNDFISAINDLKKEDESAVQRAYIAAIEKETDQPGEEIPSFPFEMAVSAEKTYLLSEPNINAERKDSLEKNSIVTVMATQSEFHFCKYKIENINKSGWIYYTDLEKR